MARPLILPLSRCFEVNLVGGKAAGLGRLLAAGFPVPPGICLTTEAYDQYVKGHALAESPSWSRLAALSGAERAPLLEENQRRIRGLKLSDLAEQWNVQLEGLHVPSTTRWAVRSSATHEDAGAASFAGLYRTHLGLSLEQIEAAVTDLWASLWTESVLQYRAQHFGRDAATAMAVVIQPTMHARVAGVCYSLHPVTGRSNEVTVNAVPGLGAPLVDGLMAPDQYVIRVSHAGEPVRIQGRSIAAKTEQLIVTESGLRREPISGAPRESSLSDEQLFTLARIAKRVEASFSHPVDLEWLFDERQLWVVQARPITAVLPSSELSDDDCEWTRANFKETLPEIPSPMGLSFLRHFMDAYILAHYRRLGCRIPEGLSAVRVLHGRPYLNATLFHSLVAQLGGAPSLNAEHMGGMELRSPPSVKRLAWPTLLRAGWRMSREMRRCEKYGPTWFADMKQQAVRYAPDRLKDLSLEEISVHLERLGQWLDEHEMTFGIVAAVGQCLQALGRLLPVWLGSDWRRLFNASLQGQGTVISAQQIARVDELAEMAQREAGVLEWFCSEPWDPTCFRRALAGTKFLRSLEDFFNDYGHRAVGESDVMTPRMAEQPDAILAVIRARLRMPTAVASPDVDLRQAQSRGEALAEIKRRLGWRCDRWLLFGWWYRRLTRFFALREANRHHLMYYSTAARHLLLRAGQLLAEEGRIEAAEDMFFVTLEERLALMARDPRDWKGLVRTRRVERMNQAARQVPDTVRDWNEALGGLTDVAGPDHGSSLRGLSISAGVVTAHVRLVRSPGEWSRIQPGHIVVAPVIDPGMAPLFALAGGLIVEMGGTLSHGAIIAREYGLPAVVNVEGAMTRLHDGQRVTLDAGAGTIRIESDSSSLENHG